MATEKEPKKFKFFSSDFNQQLLFHNPYLSFNRLFDKPSEVSGLTRQQGQDFMAELAKAPKLQEPVN